MPGFNGHLPGHRWVQLIPHAQAHPEDLARPTKVRGYITVCYSPSSVISGALHYKPELVGTKLHLSLNKHSYVSFIHNVPFYISHNSSLGQSYIKNNKYHMNHFSKQWHSLLKSIWSLLESCRTSFRDFPPPCLVSEVERPRWYAAFMFPHIKWCVYLPKVQLWCSLIIRFILTSYFLPSDFLQNLSSSDRNHIRCFPQTLSNAWGACVSLHWWVQYLHSYWHYY